MGGRRVNSSLGRINHISWTIRPVLLLLRNVDLSLIPACICVLVQWGPKTDSVFPDTPPIVVEGRTGQPRLSLPRKARHSPRSGTAGVGARPISSAFSLSFPALTVMFNVY